ncbi:MAG: fumarylacetoacetate hydrolase family protein [Pseudomonadota bacterium]|jgi:2-keto-4-pentenoate hydratase/2-oxohepta-3-ene-1,7-dioic acid hydratase (catechol pathway)|nr:MAG: fumarylacetoacetase [Pseudomonadota bacterium]
MSETSYVFPPPSVPAASVRGGGRYPVRRIFCVGRNYLEHAREMDLGADVREPPFYFTKFAVALTPSGSRIAYPPGTENFHYEMELVVALGAPAFEVAPGDALACVYGYACGLDMTRRDLQAKAREKSRPWDLSKSFEQSAVLSEIVPASLIGHPARGTITLAVNGTVRQRADIADMIWSVPEIVANLSRFYHLGPGDLIYTGTPAGVGAVRPGDRLEGSIEGVGTIEAVIVEPQ